MKNLFSWSRLGLLALCMAGAAATASAQTTPVAFTPGNYVVLRVGDGSAALSSAATPTFLLEYSPSGTLVQTIALPTADAGSTLAFTETGSSSTDGFLTRSADGRFLIIPGYNAAAGTAALASTASSANNRLVARVASTGAITGVARINDAFSGTSSSSANIRSAASADGSTVYAVGNNTGVVLVPITNTTAASTTVSTGSPTNLRSVGIYRGNLYVSSSSGSTYGVLQVGTGLPTAAGSAALTLAAGTTTSGPSSYSFFFTDQSATVPGIDVLYVADDRTTTDGGIQKWSLVNNTWTLNGLVAGGGAAVRGLTGSQSGTTVTMAATTNTGLYVLTDNAGYNAAPSTATLPTTPTAANATTNTAFRGVALAPLATALAARPEATPQELAFYPSPAQNVLTLTLPTGPIAGHRAEVRDLLGRVVLAATLPASGELRVASLSPGTYLLTLDGTLTRRFSKSE